MVKRYRRPRPRPGELVARWGRVEGSEPQVCYFPGDGIERCDMHMLHCALSGPRQRTNYEAPLGSPRYLWTIYTPSFLEELEEHGFDLETIRFSIQKKRPAEERQSEKGNEEGERNAAIPEAIADKQGA